MARRNRRSLLFPLALLSAAVLLSLACAHVCVVRTGPPPNSPYVTAHDGRLYLEGRRFRFIGVNVYSLASAPEGEGFRCGRSFTDDELEQLMRELASMRATVVRIDAYQNFTTGATDFRRLDRVLEAANRHGVRVILTLENQWPDCTEGGYKFADWYRTGYRAPYGGYALSYRDYVSRIVRRYRDEPAILMWQLMNEAESRTVHGIDDPEVLLAFAQDMAAVVHARDPNHMLSLGTSGVERPGSGGAFYALLHQVPGIDIAEAHDYHDEAVAMPQDVYLARLAARSIRRPFFIGEVGMDAPPLSLRDRARLIGEKLEAAWELDVDGVLVWSYRAGDGGNKDFEFSDPLVGTLRRFARTHGLARSP